ncbi:hypothetical protein BCY91_14100 [Pelobium manganitolerans]|uniref:Uncharacterized protein n=1 Tax=Pelobium manganitolerans TaxID=1842495 RepID=A0A419S9Z5_9SPHI|nr:hypothetical protein [Pelobium manganitolerans]RKD19005.1 hypothetical protein BCY91_14100 [Pelobium manganitolerans]
MYISKIVKEIAEGNDQSFYHGPKSFQNLRDKKKGVVFPVCYLSMPVRGRGVKSKQGFSGAEKTIEILFAERSDFSADTEEGHIDIIERMDDAAHKFVNQLLHHAEINDVLEYDTVDVINMFDANLSGVILTATVKTKDLRPNCP